MYKNLAIILLVSGLLTASVIVSKQREKRLTAIENAFAAGCYSFAYSACASITDENERNKCWAMGENCDKGGKSFREWLERGVK